MSPIASAWTPRGALIDGALTAHIERLAREWARHWFGDKRVGARAQDGASLPSAREAPTWASDNGVRVALDPNAPLGLWMLGLSPGSHIAKPHDETLFTRLGARSAHDLVDRLQAALLGRSAAVTPLSDARHDRADLVWSLGIASASNVAHIILSPTLASEARLNLLPPAPTRRKLTPRGQAIARQHVRIGAMIGKNRMAVAEMRALAAGDIVLLDRGPADLGELTLNGAPSRDDACELREDSGRLTLRLARPSPANHETTGS